MQLMQYSDKQWTEQALTRLHAVNKQSTLAFDSSDYLGLAQHPLVIEKTCHAIKKYGIASQGSPSVNGYCDIHQEFEQAFANWLGFESAILFNSGYMANLAIFQSSMKHNDLVLYDQKCHASLIDGMRLAKINHKRYRHRDIAHLKLRLKSIDQAYVVTNSVFSTTGQLDNLDNLIAITKTKLIIDDAHGLGVIGKDGRGSLSYAGIDPTNILLGAYPLSKGFGISGAMLCGPHAVINKIIQHARTYRYTTALPPAIAAGGLAALTVLQQEPQHHTKLSENINYFNHKATAKWYTPSPTAIQPVVIGNNKQALNCQQSLCKQSISVCCLRPPSVANGGAMLRITLSAKHSFSDIDVLIHAIDTQMTLLGRAK